MIHVEPDYSIEQDPPEIETGYWEDDADMPEPAWPATMLDARPERARRPRAAARAEGADQLSLLA